MTSIVERKKRILKKRFQYHNSYKEQIINFYDIIKEDLEFCKKRILSKQQEN